MSDTGALERIVDEVIAANAKSVDEFRAGKDKAFNALVGQAMKASRGKANPAQVERAAAREARLSRRGRKPRAGSTALDAGRRRHLERGRPWRDFGRSSLGRPAAGRASRPARRPTASSGAASSAS